MVNHRGGRGTGEGDLSKILLVDDEKVNLDVLKRLPETLLPDRGGQGWRPGAEAARKAAMADQALYRAKRNGRNQVILPG